MVKQTFNHRDFLVAMGAAFFLLGSVSPPLACNPSRAALTTHGKDNHSIRSERWRYVRYSDGTEELYDHRKDTLEWQNIASDPQYNEVKERLAKWLPKVNVPEIPKKTAKAKQKQGNKK